MAYSPLRTRPGVHADPARRPGPRCPPSPLRPAAWSLRMRRSTTEAPGVAGTHRHLPAFFRHL